MTTGFKINHAKDNAANFSINTKLSNKISAYSIAEENALMGLDMMQTAMDSLDLMASHLSRIRDLAEQAANGTYGEDSLKAIQTEINARLTECNRVLETSEYNKVKLFQSEPDTKFVKEVVQISEEQAVAQGYTIIKTADELQAIKDNLNGKYILMNDIDLSGYEWSHIADTSYGFRGELNGNGFIISNLSGDNFFGYTYNALIQNVALHNINISPDTSNLYMGSFVGLVNDTVITNCYAIGNVKGGDGVGGIVGDLRGTCELKDSYFEGKVEGGSQVGGLVGKIVHPLDIRITNCYASGSVQGNSGVGGLVGSIYGASVSVAKCYANNKIFNNGSTIGSLVGHNEGIIANCYWNADLDNNPGIGEDVGNSNVLGVSAAELEYMIKGGSLPSIFVPEKNIINFQVGINSANNSTISFDLGCSLNLYVNINSAEMARSSLEQIDKYIRKINEKQTEFGSAYNRFESALEAIGVSIDNLTSAQSTIRDTDTAKESSVYIRNQILQQASATLLATANQTPAIALQLL